MTHNADSYCKIKNSNTDKKIGDINKIIKDSCQCMLSVNSVHFDNLENPNLIKVTTSVVSSSPSC